MLAPDDVSSLMSVLDGLGAELGAQREEINQICRVADRVGGVQPLNVSSLEVELEKQLELSAATISTLECATSQLETVMADLRQFSHVQTVKTLSLHAECAAQVQAMQQHADELWSEQVELEKRAQDLDGKLAKAVAASSSALARGV